MMPVDEAIERIFRKLPRLGSETVPLLLAHRRVLAQPLVARHNQPPFDASAMDGYAVRAAEVTPGRGFVTGRFVLRGLRPGDGGAGRIDLVGRWSCPARDPG